MKRKQVDKLLLVTGAGRSGTKHIANLLSKAGVKLGHEQMREHGTSSAFYVTYTTPAGDTPLLNYQHYVHVDKETGRSDPPNAFRFKHVWHQVRNPLKSIGSLRDVHKAKIVRWSKEVLGQTHIGDKLKHDLEYAARHWLLVNQMAEKIADWRYRVEDLDKVWDKMFDKLGLPRRPMPNVSKTMGRSYRTVKIFKPSKEVYASITYPTWSDLHDIDPKLCKAIQKLAVRYGYEA